MAASFLFWRFFIIIILFFFFDFKDVHVQWATQWWTQKMISTNKNKLTLKEHDDVESGVKNNNQIVKV